MLVLVLVVVLVLVSVVLVLVLVVVVVVVCSPDIMLGSLFERRSHPHLFSCLHACRSGLISEGRFRSLLRIRRTLATIDAFAQTDVVETQAFAATADQPFGSQDGGDDDVVTVNPMFKDAAGHDTFLDSVHHFRTKIGYVGVGEGAMVSHLILWLTTGEARRLALLTGG